MMDYDNTEDHDVMKIVSVVLLSVPSSLSSSSPLTFFP